MTMTSDEATMSRDDKRSWAMVFAECPDWCDGNGHLDGMADHQGTVGYVSHVRVGIEDRHDGRGVGVILFAEGGAIGETLTVEHVEEVVGLLRQAQAIVTEAGSKVEPSERGL